MTREGSAIEYFREIVTTNRRAQELAEFPGKVVGTYCNFVPEELIYALGAVPVRLCSGDDEAARAGEAIFPRDTCALVKACAGVAATGSGLFPRLDLVVLPTPCDAKKKFGSILAAYKPVYMLQLPPSKSEAAALTYWGSQVRELVGHLEKLTGRRLTRPALRSAIELCNRRQQLFRRLFELRKRTPSPLTGEEALWVTGASFVDDITRWMEHVERLCAEREARAAAAESRGEGPRLLLTGAPLIYPNVKLLRILEGAGAVVAVDDLCSGTQRLYHPVVVREPSLDAMLRAVAEKCLLPPACPCFIEQEDRLRRIRELAQEFRVAGVVYHSLRICPPFDIEAMLVQRHLKEQGIPCLVLSTDYSREDTGQLRTRVEAFLEMIARK